MPCTGRGDDSHRCSTLGSTLLFHSCFSKSTGKYSSGGGEKISEENQSGQLQCKPGVYSGPCPYSLWVRRLHRLVGTPPGWQNAVSWSADTQPLERLSFALATKWPGVARWSRVDKASDARERQWRVQLSSTLGG